MNFNNKLTQQQFETIYIGNLHDLWYQGAFPNITINLLKLLKCHITENTQGNGNNNCSFTYFFELKNALKYDMLYPYPLLTLSEFYTANLWCSSRLQQLRLPLCSVVRQSSFWNFLLFPWKLTSKSKVVKTGSNCKQIIVVVQYHLIKFKMKLLTHNMLTSKCIKGVNVGYPLGISVSITIVYICYA